MTIAAPRTHLPAGAEFLLLPPAQQPVAYANVDRLFATRPIPRGAHPRPLPRGEEIDPRYVAHGRSRGIEDYIRRTLAAGVLVIAGGRIVLERYALGLAEATRWSTMSTVKSMTSTLVGAAIRAGAIGGVDDPVTDHLPVLRGSAYDGVRIRHLLTMTSGAAWTEDYTDRASDVNRYSRSLGEQVPGGVLALMRSLPRAADPGTTFLYNSGDTYLLGALISAATGRTLAATMASAIWSGMEFDGFYTLESPGGQEIGGSRAGVALRDFGRFGQFILDEARAPTVLPDGWVTEAGRIQRPLDPRDNAFGAVGYGYSWWIDADGSMVAVGFAGQSIAIHRDAGVVTVILSCWPQPPFDTVDGIDRPAERRALQAAILACCRDA